MAYELEVIPKLLFQARGNLTGNARDLWVVGIETLMIKKKIYSTLEKK